MDRYYDPCLAAVLVRGAAAAYGDEAEMAAWAREQGCPGCQVVRDDATDTLGFVAADEERAFVVFRGTRDLRNWISDLDCRLRIADCGFGKLHEGFTLALDSVWEKVAETMGQVAAGKRELFFAGHSLGGALAMLAAARWASEDRGLRMEDGRSSSILQTPSSIFLYTFGQPRVGNAAWARWYDAALGRRSFRIVHAQDVVARVPWLLGRFRHAGTEIFCDAAGRMHQDWPWWAKAPGDAAGLWLEWKRGKIALLGDHHVRTYVELLQAECESHTILRRS